MSINCKLQTANCKLQTANCKLQTANCNKLQKGFTLIELMIVVAIIGILASFAVPAYQDYTARAQVTEAFSLAGAQKLAVTEYYSNYGKFPKDNAAAGVAASTAIKGKYVASVEIKGTDEKVEIIATMGKAGTVAKGLEGKKLVLASSTPSDTSGSIEWNCKGTAAAGGAPASGTTIDPKYLPAACR